VGCVVGGGGGGVVVGGSAGVWVREVDGEW